MRGERFLGISPHDCQTGRDLFELYGDSCCGIFKAVGVFYIPTATSGPSQDYSIHGDDNVAAQGSLAA